MDSKKINSMLLGIKEAAASIKCDNPDNWVKLLGIINTIDAVLTELNKEVTANG